jgi:hypothetical protein
MSTKLTLPSLSFNGTGSTRLAPPSTSLIPLSPGAEMARALKRGLKREGDEAPPTATAEPDLIEFKSEFQKRAKVEQDRFALSTDSRYWVCFCFETEVQKQEFLRRLKLDALGDMHVDGLEAADILGVPLESPRAAFARGKVNKKLTDLTGDE